jgi:hypothetical protein
MPLALDAPMNADPTPMAADEAYDVFGMVADVASSADFNHHFLMLFSAFIGVPGTFSGTSRKLSLPP